MPRPTCLRAEKNITHFRKNEIATPRPPGFIFVQSNNICADSTNVLGVGDVLLEVSGNMIAVRWYRSDCVEFSGIVESSNWVTARGVWWDSRKFELGVVDGMGAIPGDGMRTSSGAEDTEIAADD